MISRRSLLLAMPFAAALAAAAHQPSGGWPPTLAARSNPLWPDPKPTFPATTSTRDKPALSAAEPAAAAVRAFSSDLYQALAGGASHPVNLACSPYSVAVALAMTRIGARGGTATEIDDVLHAPKPAPGTLNAGLNALDQLIMAENPESGGDGTKLPLLSAANSLWPQVGMGLEDAFLEELTRYYGSTAHPVDFRGATEAARQAINAWIGERTRGRIPQLLAKGVLTADARFVLANALYLKASWQFPFDPNATGPAAFIRDDGSTVTVPMMTAPGGPIGYREGEGWLAVDLPYVGSRLAMAVVVPTSGDLAGLEARVDGPWLAALLGGFRTAPVRLRLPRWTFRLPVELNEILARLGMPTAFTGRADFSGITRDADLLIDKVVHETFIAVDEKGTEAAAATAVIGYEGGASEPKRVTVDRPFLYIIHDVPRALPLFLGRVGDPTLTGPAG